MTNRQAPRHVVLTSLIACAALATNAIAQWSQFGTAVCFTGNVVDGGHEFLVGDPAHDEQGKHAGAVFVYSTKTELPQAVLNAPPDVHWFGSAVARAGDLDGDGVRDFMIGAMPNYAWFVPEVEQNERTVGAVYLYSGKTRTLLGALKSDTPGARFGWTMGALPDVNGDGQPDLYVSAPGVGPDDLREGSDQAKPLGRVILYSGRDRHVLDELKGTDFRDSFGASVLVLGDDDRAKLVVGSPYAHDFPGSVKVFSLKDRRRVETLSVADEPTFGSSIASIGDVDADGVVDFAVSCYGPRVWAYSGAKLTSLWSVTLEGKNSSWTGYAMAGAGESTEACATLFVSSVRLSSPNTFGTLFKLSTRDGSRLDAVQYEQREYFGASLSRGPDVDGDGCADLLVGSGDRRECQPRLSLPVITLSAKDDSLLRRY